MKPISPFALILLLLVSCVEAYFEFHHLKDWIFFTKPLLLPLLAAYYVATIKGKWNKVHKLMVIAFLFSWFGDISLMLTPETPADTHLMGFPKSKYFFLAGLGSFLVTQVLFILAYRGAVNSSKIKINKLFFLPFVIYWVGILSFILPKLQANAEKSLAVIPVIIYSGVLISMAAVALARYQKTNFQSFILTFFGACIFVISDSLIAINFLALAKPMQYAGFMIMTTYMIAEFLIAQGILLHYNKD